MGENSAIEWTDHTFNPWIGCTKVSPACDHCYAESWAKRSGLVTWGGARRRTSAATWRLPLKIHAAIPDGQRQRIFCASLADVFDNEVPDEWRHDLFELIRQTPRLDWLLLTKRIGNAKRYLIPSAMDGAYNIWVGATVVNQEEADRDIPKLLEVPARVRFLSCEPLLGPIDLQNIKYGSGLDGWLSAFNEGAWPALGRVHWVIAGGESGGHARPIDPAWAFSLRDQCRDGGAAFFFKQWGEWAPSSELGFHGHEHRPTETMPPYVMMRVGKKTAGRSLYGFTHSQFPHALTSSAPPTVSD